LVLHPRAGFRVPLEEGRLVAQQQLRLQESRQLMVNQNVDAGRAAGMVGYESASQFSREYARLFGAPPRRSDRR
jgi:transcriptional regulator GlxA family with amidase domain